MGSNMQRQAVPLIKVEPPLVATGMEQVVGRQLAAWSSGPSSGGTVTYVDAERIVIDNADEYELRKFVGPQRADLPEPEADRRDGPEGRRRARSSPTAPATQHGELALGQERARRVHDLRRLQLRGRDRHQRAAGQGRRVHVDPHRGVRRRDPRDQARPRGVHPRHPERLASGRCATWTRTASSAIGTRVGPGDILVGKVSPKSKSELSPGREAAARDLRPGRRGREERLARGARRRRGHRDRRQAASAAACT